MSETAANHLADQVAQLNAARNLVLGDAAFYPQIVNGIIPIIGAHARLELRRWGAEFLAETFASPALATAQKEQLAGRVLQTIREIIELPEGDTPVLKHIVQIAASLYPLAFRHIINHPEDSALWENMMAVKQDILRKWDSSPYPVKVCCIKFVQRVVQVQTHGPIADPRVCVQPSDYSVNKTWLLLTISSGPSIMKRPWPSFPKITPFWLYPISRRKPLACSTGCCQFSKKTPGTINNFRSHTAQCASSLILSCSDPLLVNATLNCLAVLIRNRQSVGNKIINAVLNFYPAKQVRSPLTPAIRIGVKSMERTARALFVNILKKNPSHPLAGKMQHHMERLMQSRLETIDDASKKRGLPFEPTDGLDNAKRARLDAETPPLIKIPPLPPGPVSYAQLYTLTEDSGLSSFDVKQLPPDLLVKIAVPVLARVDPSALMQAVEGVRARYQTLTRQQAAKPQVVVPEDEDDDYEPEYQPTDVAVAAAPQADVVSADMAELQPDLVSLGPFVLPQPPPLTEEEAADIGRSAVGRVFEMLTSAAMAPNPTKGKAQQHLGFSRLAGSTFDRDAWVTLLTRLATRAPATLEVDDKKTESDPRARKTPAISNFIRESLYRYILEDFRARVNVGIMWLNEEWYNDRIQMKFAATQRTEEDEASIPLHYDQWVLRLLDGFLPYLDSRDTKIFIRFLSEIPEVTIPITKRVSRKILAKWRPHVVEQQQQQQQQEQSEQQEQISLASRSVPAESTAPPADDGSAPAPADSSIQPQVSASET
ncbi:mRNA cleavage and polyadenylation specificity factor complex subunit [Aspergillus fumigatus A1163]|uniref:mRNA cleavage and polyadenylation specificity factor complex subunit n=1 Tax=Aspergillus fumigatus (strain CBS 144.89 / FGSC A1163 / CEA10) TaxID=451804 RepID=B0YA21_ASPFC|nr:mRNA cleavage and polyadenylation specificity factor complex subunit [Aspergillus fumigatus A1163]